MTQMESAEQALARAVGAPYIGREGSGLRIRPGAAPELGRVVEIAHEHGLRITPPAASASRRAASLVVDLGRMTQLLHLDEVSATVHVQAGLTLGALARALHPRGLGLGPLGTRARDVTIGQALLAATPEVGAWTLPARTIGLSVVLAQGQMVHIKPVPRRATGPDLLRLFIGSRGRYGIVTAAVLRLERLPERSSQARYALPSMDAATVCVQRLLAQGARPRTLTMTQQGEGTPTRLAVDFAGSAQQVSVQEQLLAQLAQAQGGRVADAGAADADAHAAPFQPEDAVPVLISPLKKLAAVWRGVHASLLAAGDVGQSGLLEWLGDSDMACRFLGFTRDKAAAKTALEAALGAGAYEVPVAPPQTESMQSESARRLAQELDPDGVLQP